MEDDYAHLVQESLRLSVRERGVLLLILQGHSEQAMSGRLDMSINTVHSHVKRIYKKLAVRSKGELLSRWIHPGAVRSLRSTVEPAVVANPSRSDTPEQGGAASPQICASNDSATGHFEPAISSQSSN